MVEMHFFKCCGFIFIRGIFGIVILSMKLSSRRQSFHEEFFFDSKFRNKEAQKIKYLKKPKHFDTK